MGEEHVLGRMEELDLSQRGHGFFRGVGLDVLGQIPHVLDVGPGLLQGLPCMLDRFGRCLDRHIRAPLDTGRRLERFGGAGRVADPRPCGFGEDRLEAIVDRGIPADHLAGVLHRFVEDDLEADGVFEGVGASVIIIIVVGESSSAKSSWEESTLGPPRLLLPFPPLLPLPP